MKMINGARHIHHKHQRCRVGKRDPFTLTALLPIELGILDLMPLASVGIEEQAVKFNLLFEIGKLVGM